MVYRVPILKMCWEIYWKETMIEPLFRNYGDIMPEILLRKDFFTDIFEEIWWSILKLLFSNPVLKSWGNTRAAAKNRIGNI